MRPSVWKFGDKVATPSNALATVENVDGDRVHVVWFDRDTGLPFRVVYGARELRRVHEVERLS